MSDDRLTEIVAHNVAIGNFKGINNSQPSNYTFNGYGLTDTYNVWRQGDYYIVTRNYYDLHDPDEVELVGGFKVIKRAEQPNGYKLLKSDKYNYRNLIYTVLEKEDARFNKELLQHYYHSRKKGGANRSELEQLADQVEAQGGRVNRPRGG